MFARILDCEVKMEKKDEFVKVLKNEVLPILNKQIGFHEILPFFPEKMKDERVIAVSLWATKADAERYERGISQGSRHPEAVPDHAGQGELSQTRDHTVQALRRGTGRLRKRTSKRKPRSHCSGVSVSGEDSVLHCLAVCSRSLLSTLTSTRVPLVCLSAEALPIPIT